MCAATSWMSKSSPGGVRGDVGVEQHLVEHVAELLDHLGAVAGLDGVDELPALFDEVLHEALVGLVGVPGASARRAQQRDGVDQLVECPGAATGRRALAPLDALDVAPPRSQLTRVSLTARLATGAR